jgi:hypothetical protein
LTNLLGQRATILTFLNVYLFDLALEFLQFGFQWFQELPDIGLVLLSESLGLLFQDVICQTLELI